MLKHFGPSKRKSMQNSLRDHSRLCSQDEEKLSGPKLLGATLQWEYLRSLLIVSVIHYTKGRLMS